MKLKKIDQGIIVGVYVKPSSKEFRIKIEEDRIVVFCRETPVKGRVNRELIKELSKLFKKKTEILSGITARQKRVLIRDIEANEARQILAAIVA
jgi:uncharacterized protein (TIGR00251 family)